MTIDLYQSVTDKIIASLESGVAPWVRPWNAAAAFGGMPYNACSGKPYRGINVALLFNPMYDSAAWMTYKQAMDLGAHVRKGERGTQIVFFKPFKVEDKNATEPGATKTIPLLRAYTVFNVAQIDDLPAKFAAKAPAERPLLASDAMMAKATVRHGGDRAFYTTADDHIQLPHVEQFKSQADYSATALHELVHWSGHQSRLCREYGKRFGDSAYAREELVAEIGAAFLCARVGIDGQLQHASYIASWIKALKDDKRAIVTAAAAAQRAADYLTDEPAYSERTEESSIAA